MAVSLAHLKPLTGEERIFFAMLESAGLPAPDREFRFHPTRKWRLDFAWPLQKIALEVEGGLHQMGRHNRPMSMMKDMFKYNAAAADGWRIIRVVPQPKKPDPEKPSLCSTYLVDLLKEILS